MKAVILAAGLSTRLARVTNGRPKTLLPFGDRTILDFQINSLFEAGVSEIAIVVGHGKEHVIDHVSQRYARQRGSISFIENPKFAETNNIYSVWLTRDWVGASDFLCQNADVLYHPRIIVPAVHSRDPVTVIVDPEFREETMKVIVEDARVRVMRKGIPREESDGTYIGITRFSAEICQPFFDAIQSLLDKGCVNVFFNVAVEKLIADGVPVSCTSTAGLPWAEIDDEADLEFAQKHTFPSLISSFKPA